VWTEIDGWSWSGTIRNGKGWLVEIGTSHQIRWSILWCTTSSHHYFCTTEIAKQKNLIFLIPLVKMLYFIRGLNLPEHLSKYSKLMEFFFFVIKNLGTLPYMDRFGHWTAIFGRTLSSHKMYFQLGQGRTQVWVTHGSSRVYLWEYLWVLYSWIPDTYSYRWLWVQVQVFWVVGTHMSTHR